MKRPPLGCWAKLTSLGGVTIRGDVTDDSSCRPADTGEVTAFEELETEEVDPMTVFVDWLRRKVLRLLSWG